MLKSTLLAALAAVSVSAVAQTGMSYTQTGPMTWDVQRMTRADLRDALQRSNDLRAGDQYYLLSWLDRLPSAKELVILKALGNVRNNAYMIRDQIAMNRAPMDTAVQSTTTTTTTDAAGDVTQRTTTTTTTAPVDTTMPTTVWTEDSMRPMRMVMERPAPRSLNYQEAFEVLAAGLNPSERAQLAEIFMPQSWTSSNWSNAVDQSPTDERGVDVLVRFIESVASVADLPSYRNWSPSATPR